VIPDASGLAALAKCSSDRNGEFAYSTSKGELVTVSKQGYIPIKVSFETPSSDLTITLKSNQIQSNVTPPAIESADQDSESQSMVVAQTLKAGDVIHGLVANAETGITIPMVNVYEKDAKNRIVAHALTDIEGNFRMKIVDPNDVLIISHPEYAEAQRPIANGPISIRKLITENEDEAAMDIEKQPEFPGGTAALLQFLSSNIKYPAECRDSSIEGRVIVSFVIGKDGAICEPEVVKSVHPLLDAEALRVISLMPNWDPGMQQGKPVRVKYSVPISFGSNRRRSTPEWIYLFDAKNEADDDNAASLLMSVANSNEELGALNTPEVRAFIEAYRSAQKEAQAITVKYQEELQAMENEILKKTEDYANAKQHDDLSESMRASYEQEITRARQEQQQKYQERQAKLNEWANEMRNELESQVKAAWESVSKNGAYICINMQTGIPDESIVVTPDNLESAVKDLFDGLRNEVIIKFSPENAQRMRDLLSGKYSTKSVFYMNVR